MDQHRPAPVTVAGPVDVEPVASSGVAVAEIGDPFHAWVEQRQWR
jgi:hypothetical protein